jgi:hypothetical protein
VYAERLVIGESVQWYIPRRRIRHGKGSMGFEHTLGGSPPGVTHGEPPGSREPLPESLFHVVQHDPRGGDPGGMGNALKHPPTSRIPLMGKGGFLYRGLLHWEQRASFPPGRKHASASLPPGRKHAQASLPPARAPARASCGASCSPSHGASSAVEGMDGGCNSVGESIRLISVRSRVQVPSCPTMKNVNGIHVFESM